MNRCIRLLPSKLQELHIFPLFFFFLFHNYYWRAELSKLDIFLIRSHSFQWYECQCIFLKRHFIFKKLSVKIYVGQAMTYIFPFWTDFAEFWQSLFLSINCQIWFDRPRWQTSCLAFDSGSYLTWDFFVYILPTDLYAECSRINRYTNSISRDFFSFPHSYIMDT